MKGIQLIKNSIWVVFLLVISTLSYAGKPIWTFTPLTATSISVPANRTATIQYQVTNQSAKSHSLVMLPITGLTQMTTGSGVCSNPFTLSSKGASCTLSIQVNGSQLTHSITDGPIVCEQGSTLQCYRPSPSNVLNINIGVNQYTIGGVVSGLSGVVVLQNNGTDNETISSNGAFTFSTAIAEGRPYNVTVLTQPTGQTCTITNGSGTVGSANVTNVNTTCVTNVTTLSASVSTLALSVNNTGLNAALTGTPRLITITNTGSYAATNVTYSPSPALPSGTTISPSSCGTIAASGTCVLTITPGSTPSAAPGDTSPTPITLSIAGTNTNTLTPTVNILTYGSVYQGGYVYAVDDTTIDTGGIGGKVASLTDQATPASPGIIWSSNGSGGVSNIAIYGIAMTSTTSTPIPNPGTAPQPVAGQIACNGNIDGACDSNNIYIYYQTTATNAPINTSLYATGLCKATINGYSDWYLPAICDLGFSTSASNCGTQGSPTLQNMQTNLLDNGNIGGISTGSYWSSTTQTIASMAWVQNFAPGAGSQGSNFKSSLLGVRCTRNLTH